MKQENPQIKDTIKRFVDDIYTTKDIDTLSDLRQSTKPLETEMDRCWEDSVHIHTTDTDYEKHKDEAYALLNRLKRKEQKFNFSSFYRYAAVVAVLIVSTISVLFLVLKEDTIKENATLYSELYVANGEHKTLVLPDGSQATLNSDSYIRYPAKFTGKTRMIEINGEVFLNVHPDSTQPFIVRTEQVDIKVLGTSFNVKAYTADPLLTVSVRTGKVQVDMPEATMNLRPNEMIILNKDNGEFEKRNVDSRKVSAWMNGQLYFNQTPISVVAKELERCYDCTIEIEGENLKNELVFGEHSNESLESVLKAIEYAVGIKNRKEGKRIILYKE